VQGKVQTDSTLNKAQKRINGWLAEHNFVNDPTNKSVRDSLLEALHDEDERRIMQWADSIYIQGKNYQNFKPYIIPEAHREVYKTIGGAPHLDQNYTVFGEVIEGMDVVDSVATQQVDGLDRPINDIKIISAHIVK
jgi:peptidyl-prolyl cis-trans isomerase B (cyclophilin B)